MEAVLLLGVLVLVCVGIFGLVMMTLNHAAKFERRMLG
jgi:hypothetical protein